MISIIVAMTRNGSIGKDNKMLWHLPVDLAWFKKNTLNKTVIMGRNTFESIGKPLQNRHNIVISRSQHSSDNQLVTWVKSLDEAIELTKDREEVFIIGGGEIYKQALPIADRLYLTRVTAFLSGDTYFPDFNYEEWRKVFTKKHTKDDKNEYNCIFEILERR